MPWGQKKCHDCVWCKRRIGYGFKEYCSPACKQAAYRYRKRGNQEPRLYRRKTLPQSRP